MFILLVSFLLTFHESLLRRKNNQFLLHERDLRAADSELNLTHLMCPQKIITQQIQHDTASVVKTNLQVLARSQKKKPGWGTSSGDYSSIMCQINTFLTASDTEMVH